jgi:hypothetical protein
MNLADIAQRLEEIRKIRPTHRHPHPITAFGQSAHDMAADKPRSAKNGDKLLGGMSHDAILLILENSALGDSPAFGI